MNGIQKFILDLYPTTKLLLFCSVVLSMIIVQNIVFSYLLVPLCFLIAILASKGKIFFNLFMKALLPIALMIFLLQIFFYPGETILWELGIFSISQEGVVFSLTLISRLLSIGAAFLLFFQITPIKDFIYSIEKLGMSPKAAYVIFSTFQIIPEIKKTSTTIMDAQKARGVETEGNIIVRAKAFFPTLAPLFLTSITSTEERAMALEARAFTVKGKKTRLHHLEKTGKDQFVRILLLLLLVMIIVWRYFI
ncbi:energy-coupling factor transporter transmembrane component T [Fredinandcohnia salidurans]|uniref:Energy-coupling factor transporter transmembrane component T n=1 Tax=Fredinandcohnia salidurans TaxID=2595041 RepID=A0ABW4MV68_9BACI